MNDTVPNRRSPLGLFPGQPAPRLYDRVVEVLRTRHYSRRTEEAYLHWIRRFLLFHKGTRPRAGREQPQPFPDASGRHRKCGRVHGEPGDPSIEGRLRYQNRPGTPGAQDVQTTMVYTHVLNRLRKAVSTESGGIIQTDRSA